MARTVVVAVASLALGACVVEPPRRTVVYDQPVAPAQVYVYPARGQSPGQTERDRYECHVWAVQQAGFDPSQPGLPAAQRVIVQPANPPGAGTAVGAIAGAILGAAIAGPRNAGGGAIVGAIAGGSLGAAGEANANYEAEREQARYDRSASRGEAAAGNYRRAISACLDARGYTTR